MDWITVHGRSAFVGADRQFFDRPVRMPEGDDHRVIDRVRRFRDIRVRRFTIRIVHHVRAYIRFRAVPVLRRGRRYRGLLFRQKTITSHRAIGVRQRHRHVLVRAAQPRAARPLRVARVHANIGRFIFELVRVRHADARPPVD